MSRPASMLPLGWGLHPAPLAALLSLVCAMLCAAGCGGSSNSVVLYTSQDLDYAEPILRDFTRETGIEVKPLYDSEAVKTVGLANRLIAEKAFPRCDVFWSNEELRTRQLAALDLFRPTNGWAAVGYRSRRLVINTNHVTAAAAPHSLVELTNAAWQGRVALAYPLFGTTATHFLALREAWGEARWREWCEALLRNRPLLVDGNSVVVKMVARGEAWVGLTDSDDIAAGQREGLPVAALPVTADLLLIPNTVAVIRGAPHAAAAETLFQYLQSPAVSSALVAARALESASAPDGRSGHLQPRWAELVASVGPGTEQLKQLFLR